MKMKQAILAETGTIEYREVDIPKPGNGQVLVRVRAIGICGSDIHTFHGMHPFVHAPIVLGHEAAGEVTELGENVVNFKKGERVVLRPQRTCGVCAPCKAGRYNICEKLDVLGCLSTGASSEYFLVETSILYKLPHDVDFGVGTMIEPLAVGIHAVRRGGDVRGKNVLVMGAGTIGNVTAQAAKGLGAKSVMITDISDFKLDLAKNCGIEHAVNTRNRDLRRELKSAFGDEGIELILECSAAEAAVNQAIDVAPKGINIVLVGVFEQPPRVNLAGIQDREYSLIGTLMYTHEDYVNAIKLVEAGTVFLDRVITHRFPFAKNQEAYAFIDANRDTTQKIIIEM